MTSGIKRFLDMDVYCKKNKVSPSKKVIPLIYCIKI